MEDELCTKGGAGREGPRAPLKLKRSTRRLLEHASAEFLADILTRETRRNPANVPALAELAQVCTSLGRLEDGLSADLALLRLVPDDPTVHYNLACSYALLGDEEHALAALEAAIERGYDDGDHLATDEDLTSLHALARFQALLRALGDGRTEPGQLLE